MTQRIKTVRIPSAAIGSSGVTPQAIPPRGAGEAAVQPALASVPAAKVESFLMEMADALNNTLDLDAVLHRIADLVRQVIDYRIFAILLLNERTQEMRMRFQIGHAPEIERMHIRVGQGVTGTA